MTLGAAIRVVTRGKFVASAARTLFAIASGKLYRVQLATRAHRFGRGENGKNCVLLSIERVSLGLDAVRCRRRIERIRQRGEHRKRGFVSPNRCSRDARSIRSNKYYSAPWG